MHCDCPYCKDGHDCKHEVAVLIEILGEDRVMGDYDDEYDFDYKKLKENSLMK